MKQLQFLELGLEGQSGSTIDVKMANDQGTDQSFLAQVASGPERRVGPLLGRHRNVRVTLEDDLPDNPWEVLDLSMAWFPKGRASWSASST